MSPRLFIVLVVAGIVALGTGIVSWNMVHPGPGTVANSGAAAWRPTSEAGLREYREKFFSGNPYRDVRSGEEMKPRW